MSTANEYLLISQRKLALLLGGLAIALPTILYLGNLFVFYESELLSSMSSYYHSNMRDVFVGILFAMGVFLIAYEGYGTLDRLMSSTAGILAFMVALFPTPDTGQPLDTIGTIHLLAAVTFYSILTIFCLFRFTKSDPNNPKTFRKKIRNGIYYLSGTLMLLCIILLVIQGLGYVELSLENPVFWLEYIINTSFGTAWIVKGEGIFLLNDDPILEMNPWELFGLGILILLALGSFAMLSNIILFS